MEIVESVRLDEDSLYVSIPLAEYKELLITKGKYEELKSQTTKPPVPEIVPLRTNIHYKNYSADKEERKITCEK